MQCFLESRQYKHDCGKKKFNDHRQHVLKDFFAACKCCKKEYMLHKRCIPILPGFDVQLSNLQLIDKFHCKAYQTKQCSCGKFHHGTEKNHSLQSAARAPQEVTGSILYQVVQQKCSQKREIGSAQNASNNAKAPLKKMAVNELT